MTETERYFMAPKHAAYSAKMAARPPTPMFHNFGGIERTIYVPSVHVYQRENGERVTVTNVSEDRANIDEYMRNVPDAVYVGIVVTHVGGV